MDNARNTALEMAQAFCRQAAWGYSEDLDFYRLLWEVHGGILEHGADVTRTILYRLLDDKQVTPFNAASALAEMLDHAGSDPTVEDMKRGNPARTNDGHDPGNGGDIGDWFERAISDT